MPLPVINNKTAAITLLLHCSLIAEQLNMAIYTSRERDAFLMKENKRTKKTKGGSVSDIRLSTESNYIIPK